MGIEEKQKVNPAEQRLMLVQSPPSTVAVGVVVSSSLMVPLMSETGNILKRLSRPFTVGVLGTYSYNIIHIGISEVSNRHISTRDNIIQRAK